MDPSLRKWLIQNRLEGYECNFRAESVTYADLARLDDAIINLLVPPRFTVPHDRFRKSLLMLKSSGVQLVTPKPPTDEVQFSGFVGKGLDPDLEKWLIRNQLFDYERHFRAENVTYKDLICLTEETICVLVPPRFTVPHDRFRGALIALKKQVRPAEQHPSASVESKQSVSVQQRKDTRIKSAGEDGDAPVTQAILKAHVDRLEKVIRDEGAQTRDASTRVLASSVHPDQPPGYDSSV